MPDASTLNRWSHKEVTVYIFWCLAKINTLTVLILSFEVVWDLTFFEIWPLFRRSDEKVTVDFFDVFTKINTLTVLLLSIHVVCDLTFFDLWPLNQRSGEEVTVDTFWCLTPTNTLAVLVLPFKIVQNLTPFFWPFLTFDLFSVGRMKRSPWTFFDVWPRLTHWQCYFHHFTLFVIWPFFDLWPLNHRSGEEVTVDTF